MDLKGASKLSYTFILNMNYVTRVCVSVFLKFDKETEVSTLSAQAPVTTSLTGSIHVSLLYSYKYSTNILINCVYVVIYYL